MNRASTIWVWTPDFSTAAEAMDVRPPEAVQFVQFKPDQSEKMLVSFRQLKETLPEAHVVVFDVARFPDGRKWAFVSDGIGRSGANPLRGLGPLLREPFIDVSHLYHVPDGCSGIIAVSLGSRFHSQEYDPAAMRSDHPVCGHLQNAAILAHSEGFQVTGILVAESHIRDLDLTEFLFG